MFHKLARIVKNFSFMLLSWQGNFLQKRLIKRLGYTHKSVVDGCSVDISQNIKDKREKIDNDVKSILKQCENNPIKVIEYLEKNGIRVYFVKRAKKLLKHIKEDEGFITERHGFRSLMLNIITGQGLKFNTKTMVILEKGEPDIYNLIHYLHKWYAMKEGMDGFDEKSQKLLVLFNTTKEEDKLIGRLSIPEISGLREAIARDVQSIEFVTKYSKENAGAKNALEKMKTEGSANI